MHRNGLALLTLCATLVLVPAGAAAGQSPRVTAFEAEVRRGQEFTHDLGENLAFGLIPARDGRGWHIWMGDPQQPLDDYVSVATPPYRFIRPIQIYGGHFRNSDNTGPNAPGAKNVNAPQEVRQFRFVDTPEQYGVARQALEIALWGGGHSKAETAAARDLLLAGEGWGRGVLEITDLELGNLVPHQQAWIERMAFTVTLTPYRN